jgi:hypothetical protein
LLPPTHAMLGYWRYAPNAEGRQGSCVTSVAGPNGGAQLYERHPRFLRRGRRAGRGLRVAREAVGEGQQHARHDEHDVNDHVPRARPSLRPFAHDGSVSLLCIGLACFSMRSAASRHLRAALRARARSLPRPWRGIGFVVSLRHLGQRGDMHNEPALLGRLQDHRVGARSIHV